MLFPPGRWTDVIHYYNLSKMGSLGKLPKPSGISIRQPLITPNLIEPDITLDQRPGKLGIMVIMTAGVGLHLTVVRPPHQPAIQEAGVRVRNLVSYWLGDGQTCEMIYYALLSRSLTMGKGARSGGGRRIALRAAAIGGAPDTSTRGPPR